MANIYPQQQPSLADFLQGRMPPPVGMGGPMMGRGLQRSVPGQQPPRPGGPVAPTGLPENISYEDLVRMLQQRYGQQ